MVALWRCRLHCCQRFPEAVFFSKAINSEKNGPDGASVNVDRNQSLKIWRRHRLWPLSPPPLLNRTNLCNRSTYCFGFSLSIRKRGHFPRMLRLNWSRDKISISDRLDSDQRPFLFGAGNIFLLQGNDYTRGERSSKKKSTTTRSNSLGRCRRGNRRASTCNSIKTEKGNQSVSHPLRQVEANNKLP